MTTNHKGYMKSYYHKRRNTIILNRGGKCTYPNCENTKVEFAHLTPTGIKGANLSGWARVYDIENNPKCYILLCKEHHEQFDHHDIKDLSHTINHIKDGTCYICEIYHSYGITPLCEVNTQ